MTVLDEEPLFVRNHGDRAEVVDEGAAALLVCVGVEPDVALRGELFEHVEEVLVLEVPVEIGASDQLERFLVLYAAFIH